MPVENSVENSDGRSDPGTGENHQMALRLLLSSEEVLRAVEAVLRAVEAVLRAVEAVLGGHQVPHQVLLAVEAGGELAGAERAAEEESKVLCGVWTDGNLRTAILDQDLSTRCLPSPQLMTVVLAVEPVVVGVVPLVGRHQVPVVGVLMLPTYEY